MICEKCNTECIEFKDDDCQGLRCPSCGWNVVATNWHPIEIDKEVYTLRFAPEANPTQAMLSVVSKITGKNFLETKKVLAGSQAFALKGTAEELLPLKLVLEKHDIKHEIKPAFSYHQEDLDTLKLAGKYIPNAQLLDL